MTSSQPSPAGLEQSVVTYPCSRPNGLIREYLPKGTAITDHQPYLTAIAEELNERPRAVLGYLTPREALQRLLLTDVASTG